MPAVTGRDGRETGGAGVARIAQLDAHLITLIAAGEVVERPVSAVKELAENAIDAGAKTISVEVRRGGFELIRVRDDGSGIDPNDLPLALARHATSKLRDESGLWEVSTLGFRGEALASIASVSRVQIVTRTEALSAGRKISAIAGSVVEETATSAPVGTTVSVEDLFFNVPARQAFQRSPAGETRAIAQMISHLALATPTIRWRLVVDGRDALTTPGSGSLRETMVAVHGPALGPHLLELHERAAPAPERPEDAISVWGMTSAPVVHRNTRAQCVFVVNERVVRSQSLGHAVDEAYRSILPHGRHPVATICLKVNPAAVDVNVHPTKLEVRLRRERLAYARVHGAVRGALDTSTPAPSIVLSTPNWSMSHRDATLPADGREARVDALSVTQRRWPDLDTPPIFDTPTRTSRREENPSEEGSKDTWWPTTGGLSDSLHMHGNQTLTRHDVQRAGDQAGAPELSLWRPLGQVGLTYIVAEAPDGMYLIDQHSAHERVQYEALKSASRGVAQVQRQPLLVPELHELTASQGAWLRGNVAVLGALGYELEPFGAATPDESHGRAGAWTPDAWLVRAVPWALAARGRGADVGSLIDGLIDREYGDGPVDDQARWAVACHSSVRAGDRLSMPEMHALIQQLAMCDLRQTCPHGRPTMIHLSHLQLAREFGRSGPSRSAT